MKTKRDYSGAPFDGSTPLSALFREDHHDKLIHGLSLPRQSRCASLTHVCTCCIYVPAFQYEPESKCTLRPIETLQENV